MTAWMTLAHLTFGNYSERLFVEVKRYWKCYSIYPLILSQNCFVKVILLFSNHLQTLAFDTQGYRHSV